MKLILVGVRDGKPVIYWPGVVATSVIVIAVATTSAWLVCLLLGRSFFLLPQSLAICVPMLMGFVIPGVIKQGLQTPPDQLPRLR